MRHLLKCDLFRVVQDKDTQLTPANMYGASVSIMTGILLVVLLLGELRDYNRGHRQCGLAPGSAFANMSESERGDFRQMHVVATFPYIPCGRLRAEFLDSWGRTPTEVEGKVRTRRYLTPAGSFSQAPQAAPLFVEGNSNAQKTGCMIDVVSPMPASMAAFNIIVDGYHEANPREFRSDHAIHLFRLGAEDVSGVVGQVSKATTEPLSESQRSFEGPQTTPYYYYYYIQYVRTQIMLPHGKPVSGYQYTVNDATIDYNGRGKAPGLYTHLVPSPYSVRCTIEYDSISHFIVNLCAVVGGVYTMASFLELGIEAVAHHQRQRDRAYQNALNTERAEKQKIVDQFTALHK